VKVRNNTDERLVVGDQHVTVQSVGEFRSDVWAKYKHERADLRKALEDGIYEELHDYLDGDGDLDCPHCRGRGWIVVATGQQRCVCVRKRDVINNVRRIWPGGFDLMKAGRLPKGERSPLMGHARTNLWVTAHDRVFQAHLRWVAIRMGATWRARVRFDNDLLRAWFFTAKAKGVEIFDVAVRQADLSEDPGIEDLAIPPELLILVMGVKRTRNQAAWECLMEALRLRQAINKPTWIVDQPDYRLDAGTYEHLFAAPQIHQHLAPWTHIDLAGSASAAAAGDPMDILDQGGSAMVTVKQGQAVVTGTPSSSRPGRLGSLSSVHGLKKGQTSSEDIVETEKPAAKKKPYKKKATKKRGDQ